MEKLIEKANVLVEALPYIRRFAGKSVVVKFGGSAMKDEPTLESVVTDVVLMKYVGMNPVLVHGGGPAISAELERRGIEPVFVDGLRVTDEETMRVVEAVLVGQINTSIVRKVNVAGGRGVGVSGADGGLIRARKARAVSRETGQLVDLGFVGEIVSVDHRLLRVLEEGGFIPVVAPLGVDEEGRVYNVNADEAAGRIAASLGAEKLVVLSDVPGVMRGDEVVSHLTADEAERMIASGEITGGMIPKVRAGVAAVRGGAAKCHVVDGRVLHAMLLEIFTDAGIGTEIVA